MTQRKSIRWQCTRPGDLHWQRFDDQPDQWVIYDAGSGDTHKLNDAAAAVLRDLMNQPASALELAQRLASSADPASQSTDPPTQHPPGSPNDPPQTDAAAGQVDTTWLEPGEADDAMENFLSQLIQQFDQSGLVEPVAGVGSNEVHGLSQTEQGWAPENTGQASDAGDTMRLGDEGDA